MSNIKQVVVVRKDLQMCEGLLAAQVAHIAALPIFSRVIDKKEVNGYEMEWIKQPYLVVLGVNNREELEYIINKARDAKIQYFEWIDVIPSKNLNGQVLRCLVGVALGPDDSDRLKEVIGTLQLY